jgi:Fe-S cluster biogenesis protein NfuA
VHKNAIFLLVDAETLVREEMTEAIEEQVKKLLEDVKPQLQADGGDISFVSMDNGVVKVELKGACAGCPMSAMTVQWGVERYLKSKIPEVVRVEAVQ